MSWPSCLALLRFSKVSESTEVTAQRLLRNKLVSGSVRAISNREERDMRDGSAVSQIRWHRIRWALQAESGGCAVVSTSYAASTRTCHSGQANCGAKEPAQPCVALTNSFTAWKHGDPWSHRGCKPPKQQTEPNVNFLSLVPPPAKELERN